MDFIGQPTCRRARGLSQGGAAAGHEGVLVAPARRRGSLGSPRRPGVALLAAAVLLLGIVGAGGALRLSEPPSSQVITLRSPRVVVVKSQRRVHLFDGERLVRSYPADLGFAPAGPKRLADDGRTPEGRFRVVSKNAASPNHRFLGLDYPDLNTAKWGCDRGLISMGELSGIEQAHARGGCPEWGTALGGGVGIHGGGRGEDWTAGCIALTDRDVEELFAVLRIGDEVEILP